MREHLLAVARGDEPADLVIAGGSVLSVFTGEVFQADVAIAGGLVAGVGSYDGPHTYDARGQFVLPGFIDGHCHIESSKLSVREFARVLLPLGTTSVVVDPHELANVLGVAGIEYVLMASEGLPLGVYLTIPSCVPASPMESPTAPLGAAEMAPLLTRPRVVGIAEMMNYPAAIAGDPAILAKLRLTDFERIDGHAPDVHGRDLNAYLLSGPTSDHECTTLEEALEKRRLGMWIMLREASMIRNLVDLLPLIREYGTENCLFATDDREVGTLLDEGHMNSMVRTAVENGIAVGDAVKLASLNVARYHRLGRLGAVAPGYIADLAIYPDLRDFQPSCVLKDGAIVAEGGTVRQFPAERVPAHLGDTVHVGAIDACRFRIADDGSPRVRVITLVPDQVVTKATSDVPTIMDGEILADPSRDLAKLAVVERHHGTGRVGLGLVRGFGLTSGAFASTIGHDAHNITVVGVNDEDMALCVRRLESMGGGLIIARDGHVVDEFALEIAGLMSVLPAAEVARAMLRLEQSLQQLGVRLSTPFMYLGFLPLSVIPEMRVTDRGIVDVVRFEIVPLGVA